MSRKVQCVKLGTEAEGLEAPPFEGELGQEIYEKVSRSAWLEWQDDMMMKIINEYRLDLTNEEEYKKLLEQMRTFLNLSQGETLEVENEERGRGES